MRISDWSADVCSSDLLATVLVQSSSVNTSTVVGLVGTGLLGVGDAVPVIMGANIGTTVTSTLAAIGHVRRPQEFRGAFAAARSDERRVGRECVRRGSFRWSAYHEKKKKKIRKG